MHYNGKRSLHIKKDWKARGDVMKYNLDLLTDLELLMLMVAEILQCDRCTKQVRKNIDKRLKPILENIERQEKYKRAVSDA